MPRLTLILLLMLAACIAAGGVLVARREVEERLPRDHTAQRTLVNAMQAEARALELLYEGHLKRVGTELAFIWRDSEAPRQIAEGVEGIQRVSWLFWRSGTAETHLNIGFPPDAPLPEPTIEKEHPGLPRPRVLLDAKTLFRDVSNESSGWIDEAGKPLMFFVQRLGSAVIITIDRTAVREVMTRHFRDWIKGPFDPVNQLGGPDVLRDDGGTPLASAGITPELQPDMLMPVVARFGTWQLVSWDKRETRTSYHMPTLSGAMALAVLVAVCGVWLAAQQARASKLAAQRVSFVNRVSHELRTPMTNILLNLDVIEESLPEASKGRFGLIREEAGRLSRLIENVLTFSRKEEGRLKLQNAPCRPVEVVKGIVRQFEPALERRGISLTLTHEGSRDEIVLDADALAQITANLLSNVEKYAPNAPASLRTVQNEREFILTLHDGGPGISEKDAKRVFEPFERLDDRVSAGVSGAGLGLSIAKELAERMGGSLALHEVEKGACFEFKLRLTS